MRFGYALASSVLLTVALRAQDGSAIYREHCAGCHEGGIARAPQIGAFKQMSPDNIQFALKSGVMQFQGLALTTDEIRAVSEFVTGKAAPQEDFPEQAYCQGAAPGLDRALTEPHWNGWGAMRPTGASSPPRWRD